jgi:tetratricopeptide (TPR) repeat protein
MAEEASRLGGIRRIVTSKREPRVVLSVLLVAALVLGAGTARAQTAAAPVPALAMAHRTITTSDLAAQNAFDIGLIMLYAFNIGQARDEFARAAALDPACAMAYWGEALTEITDINRPPDAAAIARGFDAIAKARAASEATPAERELIAAAASRFAAGRTEHEREIAYATAMRAYARTHPLDVDGLVETAFAIWGLPSGIGDPANADLEKDLDAALALDPHQVGALHLRIHYEEGVYRPERALGNADTLEAMAFAPGESHLDHMPGHIYDRVGDYARMLSANERAVYNDRIYFAASRMLYRDVSDAGVFYMEQYHAHDVEFLLYGYTTLGRNADAQSLAAREGPRAVARVALRLHEWERVLNSGTTDAVVLALANAHLGNVAAAAKLLDRSTPPALAKLVEAAGASARGDDRTALDAYAAAYKLDTSAYLGDPKSHWYSPVGEAYGAVLLRAKKYPDAERVFTAELARFPNDPRLLFGLVTAREAQGETADETRATLAKWWQSATPLTLDDLG